MGMMYLVLLVAFTPSHGFHAGGCKAKRRLNIATSGVGGMPQNSRLGTVLPFATRVCPIDKTPENLAKQMRALLSPDINPEDIDEATLNWYLVDRYYDPDRGARKLTEMVKWRRNFENSMKGVSTDRIARTRKGYLHTHKDILGRPVVVAVASRHNVMLRDLAECKALCVEVLEAAIKSLGDQARDVDMAVDEKAGTSYGEPEQLLGVFDLRRLHPACVDFEFIVFLIDTIYRFYPQRLGQVLLVEPPPFVFEAAWAVIKPQLGRHADIVRFVSLRDLRREYFTADTLPPDFR